MPSANEIHIAFETMAEAGREYDLREDSESRKRYMAAAINFGRLAAPEAQKTGSKTPTLDLWYASQPRGG